MGILYSFKNFPSPTPPLPTPSFMGKYDWIFLVDDIATDILTPDEAIAAIAIVAFCGSRSLAEVEIGFLVDTLSGFEIFEQYADNELWQMLDKLVATAATEGVGALFNAAHEVLTAELVLDGFAAGVSVLIDSNIIAIPRAYTKLLKQLQESLDISNDEAEQVIEDVLTAFEEALEEETTESGLDEFNPSEFNQSEFTTTNSLFPFSADTTNSPPVTDYQTNYQTEYQTEYQYTSALNNFTVPYPIDPEQGGKIHTSENAVTFTDDEGLFLRIDYYQIPPDFYQQIASQGREQYFQTILLDKYMPQVIFQNLPDAAIAYTEFCPEIFNGSYFVLIDLPKGSHLCQQNPDGNMVRLDAYRGLLAFDYQQFFYIITSQSSYTENQPKNSITIETSILQQEILGFVATIKFN